MEQQEIAAFIDVEATGLHEPEPVEVALYIVPDGPQHWPIDHAMLWSQQYLPTKEMELGAVATHHIIPWDLRNCPPSSSFVLTPAVKYLIGHNVDYDWGVIGKPNVRRICTLALSRMLWPDLPTHKLSALMYHCFGMTNEIRNRVRDGHQAANDVRMLIDVYYEILDRLDAQGLIQMPTTWEALWEVSEEARIPKWMDFGKHGPKPEEGRMQGMLIEEMRRTDPGYVKWLLANACEDKPYLKKALTR